MRRKNRITSARDFGRIMREGRRGSSPSVVCFLVVGEPSRSVRVGVTASRRIGGAVARNRAKRLLREAARRLIGSLPAGSELVLLATPALNGKSFHETLRAAETAVAGACEHASFQRVGS